MRFLAYVMLLLFVPFRVNAQAFEQIAKPPRQADLFQRIQDLRGNFDVMMISLKPGYEDASALAYFRMATGARVLSVYISNGEGGERSDSSLYPHEVAAMKRGEAFRLTQFLDCDHLFINMPDVVAAADTTSVRSHWDADTLSSKLAHVVLRFKPDVILVTGDPVYGERNPQVQVLRKDLLRGVRGLAAGAPSGRWIVNRVFLDEASGKGLALNTTANHPFLKKSYESIGHEARKSYRSLAYDMMLAQERKRAYRLVYSGNPLGLKKLDDGLPLRASPKLRPVEMEIRKIADALSKQSLVSLKTPARNAYLKTLAMLMQSVDEKIPHAARLEAAELKSVGRWKAALENLRNVLLGVSVSCSLSETLLAPRQLTFLKVDTITGIQTDGTSEIYFATVQQGWIVNEDFGQRLPLELHRTYSLLSPPGRTFEMPLSINGLSNEKFLRPFYFLIIHRSKRPEFNFVYRQNINVFLAPKFTVEVLTPFVRVQEAEQLILRLSNHSRDGVRDSIMVMDSLVVSKKRQFWLPSKRAVSTDTLLLHWSDGIKDSTYFFPVQIAGDPVAYFGARKFDIHADSSISVAVIPGYKSSPLVDALRRVNIEPKILDPDAFPLSLKAYSSVIVDRKALTLCRNLPAYKRSLDEFVESGGHLVILSQDAGAWNRLALWEGIQLTSTYQLDTDCSLIMDTTSSLFMWPHQIGQQDYQGWLFSRGFNSLQGKAGGAIGVLLKAKIGEKEFPLIVSEEVKSGRRTYVDLNFDHQWLNIHEGAFRLLVNLISFHQPNVKPQ